MLQSPGTSARWEFSRISGWAGSMRSSRFHLCSACLAEAVYANAVLEALTCITFKRFMRFRKKNL